MTDYAVVVAVVFSMSAMLIGAGVSWSRDWEGDRAFAGFLAFVAVLGLVAINLYSFDNGITHTLNRMADYEVCIESGASEDYCSSQYPVPTLEEEQDD